MENRRNTWELLAGVRPFLEHPGDLAAIGQHGAGDSLLEEGEFRPVVVRVVLVRGVLEQDGFTCISGEQGWVAPPGYAQQAVLRPEGAADREGRVEPVLQVVGGRAADPEPGEQAGAIQEVRQGFF